LRTLFYLCLLLVCHYSIAQQPPTNEGNDPQYTQVGQWGFSVALGVGQKSNPLKGGEDIPLYFIPSVHYYGEQFYFDDGVLGYSFFENEQFTLSALVKLNAHAANFYRWHPANIFIPNTQSLGAASPSDEGKDEDEYEKPTTVELEQLAKRKWALDGGLQLNYFTDNNLMFQAQWTHDVSGVYQGDSLSIKVEKNISLRDDDRLRLKLSAGVDWHSAKLIDYYYGISERDDVDGSMFYKGKSSSNWFASTTLSYVMTERWRAVLTWQTSKLDAGISASPLVKDASINTSFIGVAYDF